MEVGGIQGGTGRVGVVFGNIVVMGTVIVVIVACLHPVVRDDLNSDRVDDGLLPLKLLGVIPSGRFPSTYLALVPLASDVTATTHCLLATGLDAAVVTAIWKGWSGAAYTVSWR